MVRRTVRFNHESNINHGGYIAYWELYGLMWKQAINLSKLLNSNLKIRLFILLILKSPWFLLIKPIGCIITKVVQSKGEYVTEDGEMTIFDAKKFSILKVLGIPVFAWSSKRFSDSEIEKIMG